MKNNIVNVELELEKFNRDLNGDNLRARYEGASPTSVKDRVELITYALWGTTGAATSTLKRAYDEASDKLDDLLVNLKSIDTSINNIETDLEKLGAPHTPGRFPIWNNK